MGGEAAPAGREPLSKGNRPLRWPHFCSARAFWRPCSGRIIDTINGKRNRAQLLRELLQQGHLLACCPINVIEVYAGLRASEETLTQEFLQSLQYFPLIWPIARLAGLLKRDYSRKGVTLAATDVTIAAVALYYQLTLITDNLKHYPMKDLNLYPLPKP